MWRHELGEVENKWTLHNFALLTLFLPKIIKIGRNLTKFWEKQFCTALFWDTVYLCILLKYYTPHCTLCLANQHLLAQPQFSTEFGKRSKPLQQLFLSYENRKMAKISTGLIAHNYSSHFTCHHAPHWNPRPHFNPANSPRILHPAFWLPVNSSQSTHH